MQDYLQSREKARFQHEAARHLLQVTFPLVQDPKLLMGVANNLVLAYEHAIDAILLFERQLRLVPIYGNSPQSKLDIFRRKSATRNRIDPKHITLLLQLKELQEVQRSGPAEFPRGRRFVLADQDYSLKSLSKEQLQDWLYQTKSFLEKADQILRISTEKHKN